MPLVNAVVESKIEDSYRVQQVVGMFDLPAAKLSRHEFSVEVPSLEEDWKVGLIVGPSGSGKSTIAREVYGDAIYSGHDWKPGKPVIEGFGDASIKDITNALTAVGFSSPPAWIKPYGVLSNGEKFRADLARSLVCSPDLTIFDEFTSVVDRTVAKVGSEAVAKSVRAGRLSRRFVAVSCHYDIIPWLAPDWVVDMATCTLARGSLHRGELRVEIVRCKNEAWGFFKQHHYLSESLPAASRSYMALLEGEPIGFCAVSGLFGRKGFVRIARIVILPSYQGIGVGGKFRDMVAKIEAGDGWRLSLVTSHPGMIRSCAASPLWRCKAVQKYGFSKQRHRNSSGNVVRNSDGRSVCSFEFQAAGKRST